jgi:hypothetical protein
MAWQWLSFLAELIFCKVIHVEVEMAHLRGVVEMAYLRGGGQDFDEGL